MNKLTEELTCLLHPRAALVVYESHETGRDRYHIEVRPIRDGRMGEGMPVTYEFMNELTASYCESHSGTPSGMIPENLLYCDVRSHRYLWYNPPQKRMMYFAGSLNIPNGEYHVPGIVYHAEGERLKVFSFMEDRPHSDTALYKAPFFNVFADSSVCLGSVKLTFPENPDFRQFLQCWERVFWLTEFSHLGAGGNPTKENLVIVTKASKDTFADNMLVPAKIKLKDLMK